MHYPLSWNAFYEAFNIMQLCKAKNSFTEDIENWYMEQYLDDETKTQIQVKM